MKITPVPIDTLPPEARPVCLRLERDITALVAAGNITAEQLKTTFWALEDWCVRQVKLLVDTERAKGSSSAAA